MQVVYRVFWLMVMYSNQATSRMSAISFIALNIRRWNTASLSGVSIFTIAAGCIDPPGGNFGSPRGNRGYQHHLLKGYGICSGKIKRGKQLGAGQDNDGACWHPTRGRVRSGFASKSYLRHFDKKWGKEVREAEWTKAHILSGATTTLL